MTKKSGPQPDYSNISRAGAALVKKMKGCTQTHVARELGVTSATVHNLIHGKTKPRLELAVKIQELYGIKPSAWCE